MRKAATRGLINRSFWKCTGDMKVWNRKTGNTELQHFSVYVSMKNMLEGVLQEGLTDHRILLETVNVQMVKETYSMEPEEFRRLATKF